MHWWPALQRTASKAGATPYATTWRDAIDRHRADPGNWTLQPGWQKALSAHAEGHQTTLGPYHRAWH